MNIQSKIGSPYSHLCCIVLTGIPWVKLKSPSIIGSFTIILFFFFFMIRNNNFIALKYYVQGRMRNPSRKYTWEGGIWLIHFLRKTSFQWIFTCICCCQAEVSKSEEPIGPLAIYEISQVLHVNEIDDRLKTINKQNFQGGCSLCSQWEEISSSWWRLLVLHIYFLVVLFESLFVVFMNLSQKKLIVTSNQNFQKS